MDQKIRELLDEALNLKGRAAHFTEDTKLLGALPELDSLAVASLLTFMESKFSIRIEDDEVDGSIFETVGSLSRFIQAKVKQK